MYVIAGASSSGISGDKTQGNPIGAGGFQLSLSDYWLVCFEDTVLSQMPVSIKEQEAGGMGLTVYPNPATESITISLTPALSKGEGVLAREGAAVVYIYDVTGKLQMKEQFNSSGVHQLDISMLTNGIYIVEVKAKNGYSYKGRFVKTDKE